MDKKFLEELGLTPKEAEVYLALLGMESATIFEIKNRAKVSRMSIYEILHKLLDKGLISFTTRDGKKQYQAANPERLTDILKEKETKLRDMLPELLKKYSESSEQTRIETFIGKEGMKTAMNIILKVRKPVCVLSGDEKIFDFLKYFMPQFLKGRAKLMIAAKIISDKSAKERKLKLPLSEVRYAPEEYGSPVDVAIYGDNVNLLIFTENPIAIHMQGKEIAQSFMNYFNLMWKIAKK